MSNEIENLPTGDGPWVLTAASDLSTRASTPRFDGAPFGVDVSFFLNHTAPGRGAELHRHPYPEVFVVRDGDRTLGADGAPWLDAAPGKS